MSHSPPITNLSPHLLTEKETAWLYGTRWLMFGLGILGVLCTLSNQYIPYALLFGFVCPMIATVSWWIKCLTKLLPPSEAVQLPSYTIWLVAPVFWLPILDHILYPIKQYYQKRADPGNVSTIGDDEDSSSFIPPMDQNRSMVGNLQNSVLIALTTTCCQAYCIIAFVFFS